MKFLNEALALKEPVCMRGLVCYRHGSWGLSVFASVIWGTLEKKRGSLVSTLRGARRWCQAD